MRYFAIAALSGMGFGIIVGGCLFDYFGQRAPIIADLVTCFAIVVLVYRPWESDKAPEEDDEEEEP